MGTRAVYTFKSHNEAYHVYKHWDNTPINAAEFIWAALPLAWEVPRFEADEFAAAFIAANKTKEGDIRLIKSPKHCGDASYFFIVGSDENGVTVSAKDYAGKKLFSGTLGAFTTWARAYDEAY